MSASSVGPPKFIAPKHNGDTITPVLPKDRYSIFNSFYLSAVDRVAEILFRVGVGVRVATCANMQSQIRILSVGVGVENPNAIRHQVGLGYRSKISPPVKSDTDQPINQ